MPVSGLGTQLEWNLREPAAKMWVLILSVWSGKCFRITCYFILLSQLAQKDGLDNSDGDIPSKFRTDGTKVNFADYK